MILSPSYKITPAPVDREEFPQPHVVGGLGCGCSCAACQEQPNSLSLERFRELFVCELNPWHFYGLAGLGVPEERSAIVREHRHQSKWAGRRDIVGAIKRAEDILTRYLACPPGPRWVYDEVPWPHRLVRQAHQPAQGLGRRTRHRRRPAHDHSVQLRHGSIHAVGKHVYQPIGNFDVMLVDLDEDTCPEQFRVRVRLDALPEGFDISCDELALFFVDADRYDPAAGFFRWQIEPITVRYDSASKPTHVEIWGRAWLIVRPVHYMTNNMTGPASPSYKDWLDISDLDNFASKLTVYLKRLDHSHAGNGVWVGRNKCGEAPTSCQVCEAMNFCIVDGKEGKVTPLWASCRCGTPPDRLRISYYAGDLSRKWERIIGQLAIAELACSVCECGDPLMDEWHEDLSLNDERNNISRVMLRNPLGNRRGHVAAWQAIRDTDLDGLDGMLLG